VSLRRRITAVAIASAFLLAAGTALFRATRELRAHREQITAGERQYAAMLAQVARVEATYRQHEAERTALRQQLDAADTAMAAAKRRIDEAKTKAVAAKSRLNPLTIIANDPGKFSEYMNLTRGMVDLQAGASMHHLHLTPEQREKFKDMRVWAEQRMLDIYASADTQKLDQAGVAQLLREEGVERMKKEAEVLGDLEQEFRVYGRVQPARDYAEQLAALSVYEGTPFSTDQIESLTRILADNSKRKPNQWLEAGSVNWAAALPQAQAMLTPRQLELLRQLQQLSDLTTRLSQEGGRRDSQ
jgi:hypothetical protein